MSDSTDSFLQEVLGLFAQEAQEWITSSEAVLLELRDNPPTARKLEILDQLSAAMTNLGGSAATVELSHIERAAFAILPLLTAMRMAARVAPKQIDAVHQALQYIIRTIGPSAQLRVTPQDSTAALEAVLSALSVATTLEPEAEPAPASAQKPTLADALETFQREQQSTGRRLVETLLERIRGDGGIQTVRPDEVRRFLRESEHADARLLESLRERVPMLIDGLESIGANGGGAHALAGDLDPIAASLLESARGADSAELTRFFTGFQAFLRIWSEGAVTIDPPRFHAVRARLGGLVQAAEAWIETGRAERTALDGIIPH
ncbi:MAG TPA: hypothetical protein VFA38_11145 [Nitrospirales bacterium]|nr:hypothetical protein [Nitrospirales bacterium]